MRCDHSYFGCLRYLLGHLTRLLVGNISILPSSQPRNLPQKSIGIQHEYLFIASLIKNTDSTQTAIEFVNLYLQTENFNSLVDLLLEVNDGNNDIYGKRYNAEVGHEYIEWKEVINNYFE